MAKDFKEVEKDHVTLWICIQMPLESLRSFVNRGECSERGWSVRSQLYYKM